MLKKVVKDYKKDMNNENCIKEEDLFQAPCQSCIKKGLDCCNKLPLFNNFEMVKLVQDDVLLKLGLGGKVVIWRYDKKCEIFTVLPKGIGLNEFEKRKEKCLFFDEVEGCRLKEYMPLYCKMYRTANPAYSCPYIYMDKEEFESSSKEKLLELKQRHHINYNKEFYLSYIFEGFFKRFQKPKKQKRLKIIKDELVFALVLHTLNCDFEELEKEGLLKKIETEIFDIAPNGEIYIYKAVKTAPLGDNPFFKEYSRKINHYINLTYNSKTPLEVDVLINKTQSVVNGIDSIIYKDEELSKDFRGFFLANALLYQYKEVFKNKHKTFRGILFNNDFLENLESRVIEILVKKGKDEEEILLEIEKINDFALKFIKRVIKTKI